ncbi:hypothetical protein [Nocardioides marmotae]|uniref:hypothetical protein n=1 Tax=Nocardioides marmotae TaxID=2663857 RepID=UPI001328D18D|nr:hypothetical protein [Nocardioides marmotae]MBC9733785.1 hypothetical protein [Nocardioides marmotae]MTB84888.1 hypothetical protein [Nocardioides marmotae]
MLTRLRVAALPLLLLAALVPAPAGPSAQAATAARPDQAAASAPPARPRGTLPENPWAGPAGTATMHGDPGSSDTNPYRGPGPDAGPAEPVVLGAVCPTVLAGRDGMVQALCTEYLDRAPTLPLLDPTTFRSVASLHLEAGSLLGGVYAYLDHRDRLVTVDGSGAVLVLAHDRGGPDGTWRVLVQRRYPLGAAMTRACGAPDCDALTTLAPGYDGRLWFATADGRAGHVDRRTGRVRIRDLSARTEIVANSISTAPDGVAVTSDRATYLLRAGAGGRIEQVWRRAYDRGPARKPGQLSRGSGATPTFFGPRTGHEYVAITDNSRPRAHLLVYRAATGRLVCREPFLDAASSGTENSPIGWRRSVYVASTYGYPYPTTPEGAGEADPPSAAFVGGLEKFTVTEEGCTSRWRSDVRSAAVPKLSTAEGVVYTVTRSRASVYELARISPATGRVLSRTPIGAGPLADTLQMVGTTLPDGTLLQGNLTGLTVTRPGGS